MFSATPESVTPRTDQSLVKLIPHSSRWRSLAGVAVAIVIIVGAFVSPDLFKPSVIPNSGSGSWSAIAAQRQVVATTEIVGDGFRGVDVRSISDVDGATFDAAFVVPVGTDNLDAELSRADFPTTVAFLQAAMPDANIGPDTDLPHHLDNGERASLVIVWNIDGCDELNPDQVPTVALRTFIRTTIHEPLSPIMAPGFEVQTLRDNGMCNPN